MITIKNYGLILLLTLLACSDKMDPVVENPQDMDWLIPSDEVLDGGPGKDGIPSVDDPQFELASLNTFLNPGDLVIGVIENGVAKAYAHRILDWHEIVNDQVGNSFIALTYCPLTGTAVGWNRFLNSDVTTFGVSGKLYNTNLMPYDRASDSYWSQMRLDCVNGPLINTEIETIPVIETTWETWVEMYPNSMVMTLETGFDRNYGTYPYGDYRTNNDNIIFPVNNEDDRLPAKDRVLATLSDSENKVYPLQTFDDGMAIIDNFDGQEIVVVGSITRNFIVAYYNTGLGNLTYVNNAQNIVAQDDNGNRISISGAVVEGPLQGTQLVAVNSILGYYFALAAFYPDVEIYQ